MSTLSPRQCGYCRQKSHPAIPVVGSATSSNTLASAVLELYGPVSGARPPGQGEGGELR